MEGAVVADRLLCPALFVAKVFRKEALDGLVHRRSLVPLGGDNRHRSHLGQEAGKPLRRFLFAASCDRPVYAVGLSVLIREGSYRELPHSGTDLLKRATAPASTGAARRGLGGAESALGWIAAEVVNTDTGRVVRTRQHLHRGRERPVR